MYRLYKTLTPFLITMMLGLLVHGVVNRVRFNPAVRVSAPIETRLEIISIPNMNFPETFKRPQFFGGTVRLQALFDSDGKVKNVRPYPMLPFGVPESEAGKGQYAGYTSARTHGGFVKELPFGLSLQAIDQISKTRFIPKNVDGQPIAESVFVLVNFVYNNSRYAHGCNEIQVTVVNSEGTVWRGDIWEARDRVVCVMI